MNAMNMGEQVTGWVEQQFTGRRTISKDELVAKAQTADLPQEAKDQFRQLPQGDYTKDQLVGKIRDMTGSAIGAGMGGFGR